MYMPCILLIKNDGAMRYYRHRAIRLGFFLFIVGASCSQFREKELAGVWRATAFTEEGKTLNVDLDQIEMTFNPNGTYRFSSTLNYREAGTYYLEGPYLRRTDTLNQASSEKAVEVIYLSRDSLHFRMSDQGRERILKLHRVAE